MKSISIMSNEELKVEIARLKAKATDKEILFSHRSTCSNLAEMLARALENRTRANDPKAHPQ